MAKIEEVLSALNYGHKLVHPDFNLLVSNHTQLADALSVVGLSSDKWTIIWLQPISEAAALKSVVPEKGSRYAEGDYTAHAAARVAKMDKAAVAENGKVLSNVLSGINPNPPEQPRNMTSADYQALVHTLIYAGEETPKDVP